MSESPTQPEQESQQGDDDGVRWWGLPILAWTIAISLMLHGLAAAPFLIWEFAPNGDSFETEWLEQFDELEGIGHGMQEGRWANLEDLPAQDEDEPKPEPEESETEEPEPEPEPEPEVEEPEPESEAEEPEPEVEEPEPETEEKKPQPEAAVAEKTAPEAKEATPDQPDEDEQVDRNAFRADKSLPALERAGPTNIPDLKHYGPGNARVTALIRLDRVRGTLYEDPVRNVMQAVPDFRILAHSTGFDPIDDIDSFFMASAKPQYIQHTFLAVRHQKSQKEIREVLDRRFREKVPWEEKGEFAVKRLVPESSGYWDPRKVMLARPGLTIVGEDEWLEQLAEELPADSPLREHQQIDDRDNLPSASLLDGLSQIERAAEKDDTIVVMSAQGLVYDIPGLGKMTFEGVRLAVTNPASPTLDVDIKFESADEAQKFARSCPALKARLKKALGLEGMAGRAANTLLGGDLLAKLNCRADEEYVNIHAVYTAQQVRALAGYAAPLIPRPKALRELPPPPRRRKPKPETALDQTQGADAGNDESPDASP